MSGHLLLDACVAINLLATGEFEAIAQTNRFSFLMVAEAAREVSSLRDTVDGERVIVPVSLVEHVHAGHLEVVDLAETEFSAFVRFAAELDDGEAATLAVALARSLPMATDDRKTHSLCAIQAFPEPIRTSSLIREFATRKEMEPKEVSQILKAIERQASFVPPRMDTEYEWWMNHLRLPDS